MAENYSVGSSDLQVDIRRVDVLQAGSVICDTCGISQS